MFGAGAIFRQQGRAIAPYTPNPNMIFLMQPNEEVNGTKVFTDLATGGNAPHAITTNNDVEISRGTTDYWGGNRALALFNGSGDWLSMAYDSDWPTISSVTILFYSSNVGLSWGLFGQYVNSSNRFRLRWNAGGSRWAYYQVQGGSVVGEVDFADSGMLSNTWQCVTLSLIDEEGTPQLRLRRNGVEKSRTVWTAPTAWSTINAPLEIGRGDAGGIFEYFSGYMSAMLAYTNDQVETGVPSEPYTP